MKKFMRGLMNSLLGFLIFQLIFRLFRRNVHFPAPPVFTKLLNSRWRARITPANVILERSRVTSGKKVLEVGCGGGFLLPTAAERVGESGRVYGLDISEDMLRISEDYVAKEAPLVAGRVELKHNNAYDLPFADESLDVVYFCGALMEIPDPLRALGEAFRVLHSGGTVSVTELLPDPDYPGMHVSARVLKQAGFKIVDLSGNFFNYTVTGVKL